MADPTTILPLAIATVDECYAALGQPPIAVQLAQIPVLTAANASLTAANASLTTQLASANQLAVARRSALDSINVIADNAP